jgi:excisionase family DNA binding protein
MEIPGFITVNDAAERINRSNKRVYQLIEEEKLDAVQLGREYLVKVKSVDAYLRKRNGSKPRRK